MEYVRSLGGGDWATVGLACLWTLVGLPILVLLVECLVAWWRRGQLPELLPGSDAARADGTHRLVVLIPAHDEGAMISRTLGNLMPQVAAGSRVVVVADNCSDDTAKLAREAGAEVVERHDPHRRGKGYALDAGIQYIKAQSRKAAGDAVPMPDVLVVVDADTHVYPGTLGALARQVVCTGCPAQAINLLNPPANAGVKDWISTFAFRVRNLVRPMGQTALGIPCPLMGTGMALPWDMVSLAELGSSNLVEDMQLGLDMAVLGRPTKFCMHGKVVSDFPDSDKAKLTQRRRWEHGHLATILRQVPRLVGAGLRRLRVDLLGMALDVAVPPLALLVMAWGAVSGLSLVAAWAWQVAWPLRCAAATGGGLGLAILCAWHAYGRDIPASVLLSVPVYVLWKLPMYLAFARSRGKSAWVRTERSDSVSAR